MFVKNTFKDVGVLFKNFLHWNISKISIFVFSLLVALAMVLPVVLVSLLVLAILRIDWWSYAILMSQSSLAHSDVFTAGFFVFIFFV